MSNCCGLRGAFEQSPPFPINSERLDASVFTSMLTEIGRKSRTCATRATDVFSERKHCSRRRSHTQVEIKSPQKQLGNSKTITRKRWHGARIYLRRNARSTSGRLLLLAVPVQMCFVVPISIALMSRLTHSIHLCFGMSLIIRLLPGGTISNVCSFGIVSPRVRTTPVYISCISQ